MYFFNIEICMKILTATGTNPQMKHVRCQNVTFIIHMIVIAVCLTATLMTLPLLWNSTTGEVIGSFQSIISLTHCAAKIGGAFYYKSSIHGLMKSTLAFWNTENLTNENDKKELSTILKYVKYTGITFLVSVTLTFPIIFIRPFISKEKLLVYDGYVPEDPIFYNLMLYFECHVVIFFGSGVVGFDILFLTFILMAFSQMRIVNRGIGRVLSMDVTSPEERRAAKQTMRNYIKYHIYILNFLRNVVKTYSTLLLQIILIWIFSNCVEMFNIMRTTSLSEAMPHLMYIVELNFDIVAFYCIPCQLLINEIEDTRASILNSDWEKNLTLFKTEILMILAITDKSKVIVAGKFVEFNMAMFISAFKTMVSYYMFIVNVTQN